jgi:hypothetical protein
MTNLRTCPLTGEQFLPAEGNRRVHRSNAARNTDQAQNGAPSIKTELTVPEVEAEQAPE